MNARLHAKVSGEVQGVFFRAHTEGKAGELGLKGWVMNTGDGRVEVEAEGEMDRLRDLLMWLRKGPPSARVDKVEFEWLEPTGEFSWFRIRYG